jgi:hypothetical protein
MRPVQVATAVSPAAGIEAMLKTAGWQAEIAARLDALIEVYTAPPVSARAA